MSTHKHLVELERALEADLAVARELVQKGRADAIAELENHGGELGELRHCASLEIERIAHNAEEDLKMVTRRLAELKMLLAEDELEDIAVFDNFRERVVEAMEYAESDMESLKQRGDFWVSSGHSIASAWNRLARRLSLVRMHLIQEVQTVSKEFGFERSEMFGTNGDGEPGSGEQERGVAGVESELNRLRPALHTLLAARKEFRRERALSRQLSREQKQNRQQAFEMKEPG